MCRKQRKAKAKADKATAKAALKAASLDAEDRRQFIETVLSGVSAGVMGLDGDNRISALNRQAATLLGLNQNHTVGRPLDEAAPELAGVVTEATQTGHDAEAEVDVMRHNETRRLRVRASGHSAEGLVLTFDDITRLVAAQRNAAWKDVARRIAHEIKNPLTPIQLSAERLKRRFAREITSDPETFIQCADTIVRHVGEEVAAVVACNGPRDGQPQPGVGQQLLGPAAHCRRHAIELRKFRVVRFHDVRAHCICP